MVDSFSKKVDRVVVVIVDDETIDWLSENNTDSSADSSENPSEKTDKIRSKLTV